MSNTTDPEQHYNITIAQQVLEVGSRIKSGPSELLVQTAFKKELADQAHLFGYMGFVDLAYTLMMMEARVIPTAAGRELLKYLLELQEHPADFALDPAHGDLYTNREFWLNQKDSSASAWLGVGRARREATTTAYLLSLRTALLDLAATLIQTGQVLTQRAREFSTTLMPDYTYLLSAQPTTFGHYLLGFVYPLLRDLERLQALYTRVNRSPAGCGSTNGSRLPQDRERLRELLGFDGLVTHARDAMWQVDIPIETAALLTTILVNLDRLAEDLQIFATSEFGLVELDDRHARASKIMPQKKNPFALTHVRGVANTLIGTLATTAASARTPSGQPDNRLHLYGSIPNAIADTKDTAALMAEVISFLHFRHAHARAMLDQGFAIATELAEMLVLECGLDFRGAHRLVGYIVARHLEQGNLAGLKTEEVETAALSILGQKLTISEAALHSALDPENAVAGRQMPGGAAPEAMEKMLDECEQVLAEVGRWSSGYRKRICAAESIILQTAYKQR